MLLAWKKVSRAMKRWRCGVYGCITKSAHYKDTKQKETHIEKENTRHLNKGGACFKIKTKDGIILIDSIEITERKTKMRCWESRKGVLVG